MSVSRDLDPVLAVGLGAWAGSVAAGAGPAGSVLAWTAAALGFTLAPGLALARVLAPEDSGPVRIARAATLGPLAAALAALALLFAGLSPASAGTLTVAAGFAAALAARLASVRRPRRKDTPGGGDRRLGWWLVFLAAVVLLPHALRPWVRMRSDAWFHTAVVQEILARGLPPGDPYFAGLPLNYPWFYHAYLTAWSRFASVPAWDLAGVLNAVWLVSLAGAAYAFSRRLGRRPAEARFAAVFVPLGLSALFYLWFPLKLVRALVGHTAGWAEIARTFGLSPFTYDRVGHFQSFLGSWNPLLDKFWVMSAVGGGLAAALWLLEGAAALVAGAGAGAPRRSREAVFTAVAAFAVWFWSPPLALGVLLGLALAGLGLLLAPGPVGRGPVLLAGAAAGAGTVLAAPLLAATVTRAQAPFPLGFFPAAVPILIASVAALIFGVPGLLAGPAGPGRRLARALALGLGAAALVVVLPGANTVDKMSPVFYLVPAVAGGWTLSRMWDRWRARGRGAAAWALVLALFLPVNGLYLAALLFQPAPPPPGAEARALDDWLRTHTPPDAVVLDTPERTGVLVRVPRRQYFARETYARQWGYDPAEIAAREEVRRALEGVPAAGGRADWSPPDSVRTARALEVLDDFAAGGTGPLYVVWREADHPGVGPGATVMARDPARFRVVYAEPGVRVYRYVPGAGSGIPSGTDRPAGGGG